MRVPGGRLRAVFVASFAAVILVTSVGPAVVVAHDPPGIDRFLRALGSVESGGDYYALNSTTGAYGKYQIMPSNWPAWALKYLGDAYAPQTPTNQEIVAHGKAHDLYHWLESWRRVAYWWLTGSSQTSGWSTYATSYVNRIMSLYATYAETSVGSTRYGEGNAAIAYSGTWVDAGHRSYAGGNARQSKQSGASATFAFTGSRVVWYGPKGPTRGKAKIYLNGVYRKTVDLYAASYSPRNAIFSIGWTSSTKGGLRIVVGGTAGRPVVAIDEFVVSD
ncbi:MAG: transglycosylase family protein [Chloroflexi bacterium]|nr:transglycosylase family protein [Chloroflexota bacterium]